MAKDNLTTLTMTQLSFSLNDNNNGRQQMLKVENCQSSIPNPAKIAFKSKVKINTASYK